MILFSECSISYGFVEIITIEAKGKNCKFLNSCEPGILGLLAIWPLLDKFPAEKFLVDKKFCIGECDSPMACFC